MDTKTPPANAEQTHAFLECCLDVIRDIYSYIEQQRDMALLFEDIVRYLKWNEDHTRILQEKMISAVIRAEVWVRDRLDTPEARYVLAYMPLRYWTLDTILWMNKQNQKRNFPDIRTVCQACDRSLSLRWMRLWESPRKRKIRRTVMTTFETWLEDHPIP